MLDCLDWDRWSYSVLPSQFDQGIKPPRWPNFTHNMCTPLNGAGCSIARPNRTTPEYPDVDHGVAVGRPRRFCFITHIAFVGGMGGWCCGAPYSWCGIEERAGVLYSTTDNNHNCWGLAPCVHLCLHLGEDWQIFSGFFSLCRFVGENSPNTTPPGPCIFLHVPPILLIVLLTFFSPAILPY